MRLFLALIARTARLSLGAGGGAYTGLVFFLCVVAVVPFGVGPDMKLLARIGPAMLWIAALLATLLGLDRLFQDDRDDGSLDHLILSGLPLELVVLAKGIGHWLATGLPLVIGTPVFGLILGLDARASMIARVMVGTVDGSAVSTMSAASELAVDPRAPIAIPTSARANAAASLTPSPTKATLPSRARSPTWSTLSCGSISA